VIGPEGLLAAGSLASAESPARLAITAMERIGQVRATRSVPDGIREDSV
jgi:hypothetical protein